MNGRIRVEPSLFDIIHINKQDVVVKGSNVEFLLGVGAKGEFIDDNDMLISVNGQRLQINNGTALYTAVASAQGLKTLKGKLNVTNPLTGKVFTAAGEFKYYVQLGNLQIRTEGESRLENAHFDTETAIKKLELISTKHYALLTKLKTVLIPQRSSLAQAKKFIDLEIGMLRSEITSLEEKNFETKEQFLAALLPIQSKCKDLSDKLKAKEDEQGRSLFIDNFVDGIHYLGIGKGRGYTSVFGDKTMNKGYKLFLANIKNELEQIATHYAIRLCRLAIGRGQVYDEFAVQASSSSPVKVMKGERYETRFGAALYFTQINPKDIACKVNGNECKIKDVGTATYSLSTKEEGTQIFLVEMELKNPLTGEKEGTKAIFKTEVVGTGR
ncbi:MAG: hypothetical protein MK212_16660 [Saprospiraceae bacterium]|nr:hypothetical protein [Saprospiraceae bacterium]